MLGINKNHWQRLNKQYLILKKVYKGFNLLSIFGVKKIKIFEKIIEIITYGKFDSYLKKSKGVIHIGASDGYERNLYKKYFVDKVIWVEADPAAYEKLKENISIFKSHFAYNYLMTDKDNVEYKFSITSDNGQSSSIFNFEDHSKMYPTLKIKNEINLKSITFKSFIKKYDINLKEFSSLVIDTQGSDKIILDGMGDLIKYFQFIKIETAEFNMYKNYPKLNEISEYLKKFNFEEIRRIETDLNDFNQKVYDVLFFNRNF